MTPRLLGAVVLVNADGRCSGASAVRSDTAEDWAEATDWLEPRGRDVVRLRRVTDDAVLYLDDPLDHLLANGWERDHA